jgi:hypothetical protein
MANIDGHSLAWLWILGASVVGCPQSKRGDAIGADAPQHDGAPHFKDAASNAASDDAAEPSADRAAQIPPAGNESIADRLKVAGLQVEEVTSFFSSLKSRAADGNRSGVCELAAYPLSVHSKKGEQKIPNLPACQAKYDQIFTSQVLAAIAKQSFEQLFANWRGVMIGDGELWFSGVCDDRQCLRKTIRIISVNN